MRPKTSMTVPSASDNVTRLAGGQAWYIVERFQTQAREKGPSEPEAWCRTGLLRHGCGGGGSRDGTPECGCHIYPRIIESPSSTTPPFVENVNASLRGAYHMGHSVPQVERLLKE